MNDQLAPLEAETLQPAPLSQTFAPAELDVQIATARRFPRSIERARQNAISMACLNGDIAQACFYTLKRAGKPIRGPSVRLAEIMSSAWGNIRSATRLVSIEDIHVVSEGIVWDLETNNAFCAQQPRRITKSNGDRYSEDMILVTAAAAMSIAWRNAVFRVIPRAYINELYERCCKVAVSGSGGLEAARKKAIAALEEKGVKRAQIYAWLGVEGEHDCGMHEVNDMQGVITAIAERQTTIDEQFGRFANGALEDGAKGFGFKSAPPPPAKKPEPAAKE